jgi:hypothetical protein
MQYSNTVCLKLLTDSDEIRYEVWTDCSKLKVIFISYL